MSRLGLAAHAVLCINPPFGYPRAGARKFPLPRFAAVHLSVPLEDHPHDRER